MLSYIMCHVLKLVSGFTYFNDENVTVSYTGKGALVKSVILLSFLFFFSFVSMDFKDMCFNIKLCLIQ